MKGRSLVIAGIAMVVVSCAGRQPPPVPAPDVAAAKPSAPPGAAVPQGPDEHVVIIFGDGNPDTGPAPLTVEFTVDDPLQQNIDPHYHWDFGDGSPPSDKRAPTHVYERPGRYTARITVTDNGKDDDDTVDIIVK